MIDHSPDHIDEVKRLFNTQAATWPARYAPGGIFIERLELFIAILGDQLTAGGRVLDFGCGTGEIARATAATGLQVTGCDISEIMLRSASSHDPSGAVEWMQLDEQWRKLPFSSSTFDAIVAASVLEYVEDPSAVLDECTRILRPGGLLVCTVPDPRHPIRWLELLAATFASTPVASLSRRNWPRLEEYMTYLQVSRQRHTAGWWRTAAERAGLRPIPCPVDTAGYSRHSRLRLLMFVRPREAGTRSRTPR
jgi:2-polyprenyl-3-methyl-5-hydroxy-6-metoxy-1,4-benzoquinol methylase